MLAATSLLFQPHLSYNSQKSPNNAPSLRSYLTCLPLLILKPLVLRTRIPPGFFLTSRTADSPNTLSTSNLATLPTSTQAKTAIQHCRTLFFIQQTSFGLLPFPIAKSSLCTFLANSSLCIRLIPSFSVCFSYACSPSKSNSNYLLIYSLVHASPPKALRRSTSRCQPCRGIHTQPP